MFPFKGYEGRHWRLDACQHLIKTKHFPRNLGATNLPCFYVTSSSPAPRWWTASRHRPPLKSSWDGSIAVGLGNTLTWIILIIRSLTTQRWEGKAVLLGAAQTTAQTPTWQPSDEHLNPWKPREGKLEPSGAHCPGWRAEPTTQSTRRKCYWYWRGHERCLFLLKVVLHLTCLVSKMELEALLQPGLLPENSDARILAHLFPRSPNQHSLPISSPNYVWNNVRFSPLPLPSPWSQPPSPRV